jgi:hypothetical protein
MSNFLSRFIQVILILAAVIGCVLIYNNWQFQKFIAQHQGGIAIIGDSHAATNINPEILRASNYGHTAESLLITSQKLKWISTNLRPDTVLLVISPNNFSGYNDHKLSKNTWSSEMTKRYFSLFNWDFSADNTSIITAFGHYFRKQIIPNPSGRPGFLGKHTPKSGSNEESSVDIVLQRHFNPEYEMVSTNALTAVEYIIQICKTDSIALVAVEAPLLPDYRENIPEEVRNVFNQAISILPNQNVPVVLTPDQFFNSDHLNEDGAKTYTNALNEALN